MAKNPAAKGKHKKYLMVRYGQMNLLGLFEHAEIDIPKTPARVVVKTEKGLELGYLVGQLTTYKAGQFKLSQEQLEDYYNKSEVELSCEPVGKFIRYATAADISEERHLRKIVKEEIKCCERFIKELNLPMKIIDAEHILGGERIVYYFRADGRIDFRELVKKLAHEYQTRIEMRQVGSRDEAKLLGDIETCGQQCCCQRFLKALKPVNMRMAKMQKATLDPSKISGYCGRLKCCLRFEDETYTELKKKLPKKNTRVKTPHGLGKVIDTQILTQLVLVEHDSGEKIAVGLENIEIMPQTEEKRKDSDKEIKKPEDQQNENEDDISDKETNQNEPDQ